MRFLSLILFLGCFTLSIFAHNDEKNNIKIEESNTNNNSQYIKNINKSLDYLYDSINICLKNNNFILDSIKNVKIPEYPTYIYEKRIEVLNEITPIKLEYNEYVQKYIVAYGVQNREKLQSIMSKSAYYFPIFEEYLDKYNLPLELKYLAAVESALDPTAVSKSGAVGLWQFMKPTAEIFNIKITSYIDERRDVYKSTEAACKYLKYLYQTFGDWQLALAAYNGGPGTLTKAIAQSGGKHNYWELRPYLTNQMQNYIPAFIAMNYLMSHHYEHNIFPNTIFLEANKIDTIYVKGPLYLKNIAELTNTDLSVVKSLNPIYTHGYIPKDDNKHLLVLPNDKIYTFIEKKEEICRITNSNDVISIECEQSPIKKTKKVYHNVVQGDNLLRLSMNYECTINEIKEWNKLSEDYFPKIGDKLMFYIE